MGKVSANIISIEYIEEEVMEIRRFGHRTPKYIPVSPSSIEISFRLDGVDGKTLEKTEVQYEIEEIIGLIIKKHEAIACGDKLGEMKEQKDIETLLGF